MIVVLGAAVGAAIGGAAAAIWWSVDTLLGWPTITEQQAVALVILGAVGLGAAAAVAFMVWD